MSKYELKNFQKKAYNDYLNILQLINYREIIKEYSKNPTNPELLLEASGEGTKAFHIQLDAPTGAGKTVMVGHILNDFHKDYVSFVFSPGSGNLHEQTARRLEEIIGEQNVVIVDDTTFSQELQQGVTYVANWEKMVSRDKITGDYKNRIVRDGDTRNLFDALIELGNKGIPVVIFIDESHIGKGSAISSIRSFLNDIKLYLGYSPLYFEVSATPILDTRMHSIKVPLASVQKEELIRKAVRLNGNGLIDKVNKLTPEQRAAQQIEPFLIDAAIELKEKIDTRYIENDAHVMIDGEKKYYHALIGLQVPNGPIGNAMIERVEAYLRDKHGITRDNGKLVLFLSNDKSLSDSNMKNIDSPSSPAEVLIYKQGVATGWDCPRAQILLGFRHITSKIFTKQNLGRFVRTTEQKYYNDDLLDYTWVISNVGDLGQASFGDDVDTTLLYEKDAILRISSDGHVALSSFNKVKIEKTHWAFVNQTRVSSSALNNAWHIAANDNKLWEGLRYSNVSMLGEKRIVSGELSMDGLEVGDNFKELSVSASMAEDNDKQYRDYEAKVYETIVAKKRNYGANAQIARTLARIIIRWYRVMVWDTPNTKNSHAGKRKDIISIIAAEEADGIRIGNVDENDFAVEQLSLDSTHWNQVAKTINKALDSIPSSELMTDEEFRLSGSSWAERKLQNEGSFVVKVTEPIWFTAIDENKVGLHSVGSSEHYAYCASYDKNLSYRSGNASLSGPEESFEKNAIPSLITPANNGKKLEYYFKSPENNTNSFRIGVKTLDDQKVSDFYPDYLGEIYNPMTETREPFIIEVKSEDDVTSANGNIASLLTAKAKALVDLSVKENIKAGIAFEKKTVDNGSEWVIITEVDAEGKIKTESLKDYLFS